MHFRAGREYYSGGDFLRAAQEFSEAHRLSGRPELLFNVYVAYRDAQLLRDAATALRRYLAEAPNIEDRAGLESRLEALEEAAGREEPSDEVRAPEEAPTVRASSDGPPASSGASPLPWIVAGVGGALLVAGTITGILALGAQADLEETCPTRMCAPEDEAIHDRASSLALVTDVLLGVGIVTAGAGLVWALLSDGSDDEPPPVAAMCGPSGCAITGRWSL